jgi:hypothetical protein
MAPLGVIELVDRNVDAKGLDSGPTMLGDDEGEDHEGHDHAGHDHAGHKH